MLEGKPRLGGPRNDQEGLTTDYEMQEAILWRRKEWSGNIQRFNGTHAPGT